MIGNSLNYTINQKNNNADHFQTGLLVVANSTTAKRSPKPDKRMLTF
jgi:hypothetical protein